MTLLLRRTSSASDSESTTCTGLGTHDLVISRTSFIVAITLCVLITGISLIFLIALLYREYARRKEYKAAKAWGRKSTYNKRISIMRREIDQSFSQQYSGCLVNDVGENPFMGSDSPIEIMAPERVWEVPAVPAVAKLGGARRKSRMTLWFDHGVGLWMPRR